jgi:hypothetical protein
MMVLNGLLVAHEDLINECSNPRRKMSDPQMQKIIKGFTECAYDYVKHSHLYTEITKEICLAELSKDPERIRKADVAYLNNHTAIIHNNALSHEYRKKKIEVYNEFDRQCNLFKQRFEERCESKRNNTDGGSYDITLSYVEFGGAFLRKEGQDLADSIIREMKAKIIEENKPKSWLRWW